MKGKENKWGNHSEETKKKISSFQQGIKLEEWKALATEEQWREYRSKVLEKGHVIAFAQDIAGYYRDVIRGTCVEELYYDRIKQGHDFLTEIHKKAIESGIEVKLEEVNQPLAIAETM